MLRSLNIFRISENCEKIPEFWQNFRNSDVQKFEWFDRSPIEPFNPDGERPQAERSCKLKGRRVEDMRLEEAG